MIMDSCADLLPDYFNFVRGVVESPDLSLNISRELLQHDRQLKIISANLEKKIKAELERMLKDDRESYEKFYRSFGRQLKLCTLDNYGAKKEQLQDLLLFYSSTEKKPVTLTEYVSRMQPDQTFIYFASGDTVDAIDHMPQTELLKDHNMEILYFTDKADEFLPDMLQKYQDKPFRSAIDGDLELGDEQKPDETDSYQEGFAFLKEALGDKVDQVKASSKLKTHPVCLSSGQGITFEMEKYFTAVQPELGMKAKRILEINVDHPAFGTALLGRWLESHGYRVGVVAQPRWDTADDIMRMGRPRLFVGVTAGAVDSMLAHYTAFRKKRHDDAYTPGGRAGARPNRAVSVYASLVRRAFPGLPVVAGGIEASLRRVSHYDFWTDSLRKSLLPDARLDLIVYGMGEAAVLDIARRLDAACAANFVDAADILPREEVARLWPGFPARPA